MLGRQINFAGRRSRRLGRLKEREESLGADGVYEQRSPDYQCLSCEFPGVQILRTSMLTLVPPDHDVCRT